MTTATDTELAEGESAPATDTKTEGQGSAAPVNASEGQDTAAPDENDALNSLLDEITGHKPDEPAKEKPEKDAEVEPEAKEPEEKAEADPEEKAEEEKDDAEKPDEADDVLLSETERKALSKKANARYDKLLEERKNSAPAISFAKAIEADMKAYGLDGRQLKAWIDTGGLINTGKPDEAVDELVNIVAHIRTGGKAADLDAAGKAQILRDQADLLSPIEAPAAPEPQVVFVPRELADAVEAGTLTQEDAEALALKRHRAKNPPPPAAQRQPAKAQPTKKPAPQADPRKAEYEKAVADGTQKANAVFNEFKARYASDWSKLEPEIDKFIRERAAATLPAGYEKLARDACQAIVARHKPAPKVPPKTGPPAGKPPEKSKKAADLTDADIAAKIVAGTI
jgi:hypothetical protein